MTIVIIKAQLSTTLKVSSHFYLPIAKEIVRLAIQFLRFPLFIKEMWNWIGYML